MRWPFFLWRWRKLPPNVGPVCAEWPVKEGGICVYAWTDRRGKAYIAVKTLHRLGKATGLPDWLRRRHFTSDMVVGFVGEKPLVVSARIRVMQEGLELTIRPPRELKSVKDFIERRFSSWDSHAPCFSVTLSPEFVPPAARSFSEI